MTTPGTRLLTRMTNMLATGITCICASQVPNIDDKIYLVVFLLSNSSAKRIQAMGQRTVGRVFFRGIVGFLLGFKLSGLVSLV